MDAMQKEIHVIEKNETYSLVNRPKAQKVIGVKWVYKTKLNVDGFVKKLKARLVIQGYL